MPRELIGHRVAVNVKEIRRELYNGREHIVIPSYTLPDDVVMNGGLYPHDEIEKSYATLEGTLAPLGHPVLEGEYISAQRPEAINAHHIGAFNRNVKREGKRIFLEKWVDVETAASTEGGRKLLEAIDKGEPIHTSTGIFLEREPAQNAGEYRWVARNMEFDHDAILLDEPGAATPEQGVGMLVNVAEGVLLGNAGSVLKDGGYRAREQALHDAARAKFPDQYPWIANFDDSTVIVSKDDGKTAAYPYTLQNGVAAILDNSQPVRRVEDWVANLLRKIPGIRLNSDPQPNNPPAEGPEMDRKELDEALSGQATTIGNALAAAVKPLADALAGIAANQQAISEQLTANTRAAEANKRAVVEKVLGKNVADSLTGNALDDAFERCKPKGGAPVDLTGNAGGEQDPDKFEVPE